MSIRYDLPRGQFFDEEHRYVNPGAVAEKLRQAEAEVAALTTALAAKDEEKKTSDLCIKHLSLDNERLEAENERLRCCGNCGHNGGTKCCEPRLAGATGDLILTGTGRLSCRFTPSRWQRREG